MSVAQEPTLAIVVPCHNEELSIPLFLQEVDRVRPIYMAEQLIERTFVFVDDGSTDRTLEVLRSEARRRNDVHYVSFSRNFGKEAALLCGMREALDLGADYVAVMDADLQDPPSLLPEMFATLERADCDVAAAYRRTRAGEPRIRSWFARRFYALENRICEVEMRDGARDFRVMTRRVVQVVCDLPERERFSKGLFQWVGFQTEWVGYDNTERAAGTSSWSFFGLVRYAIDGILSFSLVPLEAISIAGLCLSVLAVLGLLYVFIKALVVGNPVAGWPSTMCIILLLGGLQLFALGVIGLYLGKTMAEVKGRPRYVVAERDREVGVQGCSTPKEDGAE